MAWWQKKLLRYGLRYGLQRTGFLDDEVLDLDNLDITIGKKNVIELKDIGLNIKRIAKLAQLPPCLRIETARIVALRLIIPADFYQASIVAEIDGVDLVARLDDAIVIQQPPTPRLPRDRSPATARTPQHRKTNRRIHSPPPYDPGGRIDLDDDAHIPTTQEVAQSFLKEEPARERQELEASVAANTRSLEESFASESSDGERGTGIGIGLPAFLTSFLQGLVDRFRLEIRNFQVKLETDGLGDAEEVLPITLRLSIGAAELRTTSVLSDSATADLPSNKKFELHDISLQILSHETVFADLSGLPSRSSSDSKSTAPSLKAHDTGNLESVHFRRPHSSATKPSSSESAALHVDSTPPPEPSDLPLPLSYPVESTVVSAGTTNSDFVVDRINEDENLLLATSLDLDIHPGDDNISWGSRRSQLNAPAEDLWKSMVSEDDIPDPLVVQPGKVAGSRSSSSRGSSPYSTRQKRANSPFEHGFQSPGSWPRLDKSPERQRIARHPGSWPAIDRDNRSTLEPLDEVLMTAQHTDNKRSAVELHETFESPGTSPGSDDESGHDLLESQVFSHEEAESMYMSAMTGNPTTTFSREHKSGAATDSSLLPQIDDLMSSNTPVSYMSSASSIQLENASGNATPRPHSPELYTKRRISVTNSAKDQLVRQILHITFLSIAVPTSRTSASDTTFPDGLSEQQRPARSTRGNSSMPGAFSAYSEMSASIRNTSSSFRADHTGQQPSIDEAPDPFTCSPIEVTIDSVYCQLDIPIVRLLYNIVNETLPALGVTDETTKVAEPTLDVTPSQLKLHMDCLRLSIKEHVSPSLDYNQPDQTTGALDVILEHTSIQSGWNNSLSIEDVTVLLAGTDLLTIKQNPPTNASIAAADAQPAVVVNTISNRVAASGRPITDVTLQTNEVRLTLDMTVIDEAFAGFGGLSGVLEVGNSILSESSASSPRNTKPHKGVRFAGETEESDRSPEFKFNCRLAGITSFVRTPACAASIRTTTLKAVYREEVAVVTLEHVKLALPIAGDELSDTPIYATLTSLRVEYLVKPPDKDLERLLSLLTPSHDKYDNDDDILIDTLLRQRRKGSLLRVAAGDAKLRLTEWDCATKLSNFADDLSKLSAVAKYLPEDERPGILTLLRVKEAAVEVPVNDRFGGLCLLAQDLHLAHVGLPALLAFAVGRIDATQINGQELLHPLLQLTGAENLPSIMARMLGDEEEPVVKLKLFNVCIEYNVPILLQLTGIDEEVEPDEIVMAVAQSVANLAIFEQPPALKRSPASDLSSKVARRTTIDLLVHDSAIGLTPQKLDSKALLVLQDVQLSTQIPPQDKISAKLVLRKTSLLLTDHAGEESSQISPEGRISSKPHGPPHRLLDSLANRGFVQMASVRAATIKFRAEQDSQHDLKRVEVDVQNELLLLETCADSTQTLMALLSALTPPTPSSKVPQYLTEPAMPIEDLIKSFSGDALPVQEDKLELLYDVDEEVVAGDVSDLPIGSSLYDEADDLLVESAMNGSLYGPTSAIFGIEDSTGRENSIGEDYPETAESLLEEDPFEMTNADDVRMNDAALMRDLARQCRPALPNSAVDLGMFEIEDLGFDALGSGQQVLGMQHRFGAPVSGDRGRFKRNKTQTPPFRLRVRDFHVIWHLYDGYDWQRTRDGIIQAVEDVEQRAEERRAQRHQSHNEREDDESVIGDFLFNSIYIGIPSGHDAQELRRAINRNIDEEVSETASIPVSGISRPTTAYSAAGQPRQRPRRRLKLGRSKSHKISFELKGVSADVVIHPPGSDDLVSSVDLRLKNFEIYDKVPSSTWRKFLTHMTNDPAAREMSKPMFHIQLDTVKTLESHSASEIRLHVTVLPLRLHVDQDTLDFITRFFEFKLDNSEATGKESERPFIQRIEVETVDMCLDYKPKTIDYAGLRSGKTTEFMNIITLEAANIRLKHAIAYGVKGFEDLHPTLNDIWMPDIKRNQLPTILAGLAPVRSLVNLGSGFRDVVAIPIREYKKDGRIVRSIQKGAFHFGKTTTSELARLGAKVALGTQTLLSNAEELLSPAEGSSRRPSAGRRVSSDQGWHDVAPDDDESDQKPAVSAYAKQPIGLLSGLRSARRYLEHDLLTARDALIAVQGEFLESRGPGDVASAIGRHAPTVILRPVIGGMRAVGTTLLGVGNQIDKDGLRRMEDKYKPR